MAYAATLLRSSAFIVRREFESRSLRQFTGERGEVVSQAVLNTAAPKG